MADEQTLPQDDTLTQQPETLVLSPDEEARYAELESKLDGTTGGLPADDTAAESGEGTTATQPDEPDEAFVALASRYGLTPDQAKGYTTEELDRFGALFDQRLLAGVGSPTTAPEGQEQVTEPAKPETKPEEKPTALPDSPFTPEELEELDQNDPLVRTLIAQHTRLKAFDDYFQSQQQLQQLQQFRHAVSVFDSGLESLGLDELFGKGGDIEALTDEQRANRGKAFDTLLVLRQTLSATGLSADLDSHLVQRACRLAFSDEFNKHDRKKLSDQLRSASRGRLGTPTRTTKAGATEDVPLEQDPELTEFYESAVRRAAGR